MLFYTWVFIIFNLVWSHVDHKPRRNVAESEFSGVLQNITRVNKVLQELIHNYKELQSLYSTEDTFDKVSDGEDIHVTEKDAAVREPVKVAPSSVAPKIFPITNGGLDYFNSGENDNNSNYIPKIKQTEKTKKPRDSPQVLAFQLHGDLKDVQVDAKNSESAEGKLSKEEKGNSNELKIKTGNIKYSNHNIKKLEPLSIEKYASDVLEPNKDESVDEDEVLRSHNFKFIQNAKSYTKDKIWVKIPRELKNAKEANKTFELYEDMSEDDDKMDSQNLDDEESDLEVSLNDDRKQTNILRAAYGDACLRLIIRKCHKALKDAVKDACSDSGCKSRLRRKLKKASKSKCLQSFIVTNNNNSNDTMRLNPLLSNLDGEKGFIDMTRTGYLATYCITETEKAAQFEESIDKKVFRNETPAPYTVEDTEMNILRDRYERACIKVSRKKCISACKCTFKDTCKESSCHKSLKKVSKKSCKRKCNKWFKDSKKKSVKNKDSDSDSDSDADSDESNEDSSD